MFTLTLVNTCILHHFAVGGPTNSQDTLQMLQRFVNKLRHKILKSAGGYCFDQNLQSWLDGASNKFADEILMILYHKVTFIKKAILLNSVKGFRYVQKIRLTSREGFASNNL